MRGLTPEMFLAQECPAEHQNARKRYEDRNMVGQQMEMGPVHGDFDAVRGDGAHGSGAG
jgi:hypothetical protein